MCGRERAEEGILPLGDIIRKNGRSLEERQVRRDILRGGGKEAAASLWVYARKISRCFEEKNEDREREHGIGMKCRQMGVGKKNKRVSEIFPYD
jgi:hypothetical protein